jgi:hypothetical protein
LQEDRQNLELAQTLNSLKSPQHQAFLLPKDFLRSNSDFHPTKEINNKLTYF